MVDGSNMLARSVSRASSRCRCVSVMRCVAFVVGGSMRFIRFTARAMLEEPLLTPEGHRHQTRHVERRARRRDRTYQPYQPTEGNVRRRGRIPSNLVFGPKPAQWNDA